MATVDPKNPQRTSPRADVASDLPADLVQKIEAMLERIGRVDYYAILGLARSATRADVRHAFLAVAPQFHPDKYFGRNLGSHGPKMDRVFAQLSLAHDTLADDERRAEYTRGLPPPVEEPPPPPSPPPAPKEALGSDRPPMTPAAPRPEILAAATRARQQAFAAKLAGPKRMTPMPGPIGPGGTAKPGAAPRRPISSPGMPAVDPKAAVDALKRRYEEKIAQGQGRPSPQGLVHAAEAAAAKGDFGEAARLYRAASEHSSDAHLKAVLVDTEAKAKAQSHAEAIRRAKEAEEKQEYGDAGMNWSRAFDLVPAAETAHRASTCFRRGGADLRRAAKYGDEAVKIEPNKASYRVNLALVYADLGMALRARGEIDRAHTLEPQNAQVKEAIVRIRLMK